MASSATLTGTGTIAGEVQVQGGGTFSPGQLALGQLTLNSNLTLVGAATAGYTLGGTTAITQYTQALVGGQINLGTRATLSLALANGYMPAVGDKFYLIDDTGTSLVLGSFANAPLTGSLLTMDGVTYLMNYLDSDPNDPSHTLGNDISLMVVSSDVPEPSTLALLGLGGVSLLGLCLRQRRSVQV